MKRQSIFVFILLFFCMCSPDTFALMYYDDGGTHNITTTIDDDVWVDWQSPGTGTTVNVLDGGNIPVDYHLVGHEDSVVNILGGSVFTLDALHRSQATVSGGVIDYCWALNNSQVTVSGGSINTKLGNNFNSNSQVTISGEAIVEFLTPDGNSQVTISGGSINSGIAAQADSQTVVFGGSIGGDLRLWHNAVLTIYGSDFAVDGTPVGYIELTSINGLMYDVEPHRQLTGTLLSGEPLDNDFRIGHTAKIVLLHAPSTIVYTGDLSKQYSDQADLSATLVDEDSGVGISGQTIIFTIDSQSVSTTTLSDGSCSASLTMNQAPGPYTVTVSYAGNENYGPSSDSQPFEIMKENTILTYTGDLSEPMLFPADLSANLLDEDTGLVVGDVDRGIEGCTVSYSIGSQSVVATTLSDGSCSATLTINQVPSTYTVATSFLGNTYYQPSSDSDIFQITDPLIITPSGYDFGDVVIGTSSNVIISILGNGVTPTISGISIIGSTDFSVTTMPSLPVSVPLDLEIAFTPTLEGYDSAVLRITATSSHTSSTITYDVPLEGVGVYAEALIDILDDTITPKTKWIKCQIRPPTGYSYADIDIETILLDWQIPVSRYSFNERKQRLVVTFPASGLNLEPSPDPLELTVYGELTDGTLFEGSDFVTVVSKGGKKK